eukprot:TRINITY_DN10224_c0_g1_i1.p1 TRINITY_DN10224_c0_g1~~TRINITY_DN10224_c0_g1_i1.p1  ORF type:complete len:774 (-),score=109.12 TRINITY_DN10224_c0_g1_i1:87-2408(-)
MRPAWYQIGRETNSFKFAHFLLREGLEGRDATLIKREWLHLYPMVLVTEQVARVLGHLFLVVPFLSPPLWCCQHGCGDTEVVQRGAIPPLPLRATLAIEFVCTTSFIMWLASRHIIVGNGLLWRWQRWFVYGFAWIDILVALVLGNCSFITAFLRPFMFALLESSRVRRLIDAVHAFGMAFPLLVLLWLWLFFFGWVGMLIWVDTPQGAAYFPDQFDATTNILVLLTTANHPDVLMPAYTANRFSWIFFAVFLLGGLYLWLPLLLASLFSANRRLVENSEYERHYKLQRSLDGAFEILLEEDLRNEAGVKPPSAVGEQEIEISFATIKLFLAQFSHLDADRGLMDELLQRLDTSCSQAISRGEFTQLVQLVEAARVQVQERRREALPEPPHPMLDSLMSTSKYETVTDVILLANIAVLLVLSHRRVVYGQIDDGLEWADRGFVAFYVAETTLRCVARGFWRTVLDASQQVDHFCTALAVVSTALAWVPAMRPHFPVLLVLRAVRLARLLTGRQSLEVYIRTIPRLRRAVNLISPLVLVVVYEAATIGMLAFGGKIRTDNPALDGSAFAQGGYWPNNFNDFGSSLVVLFDLLVVNNWQLFMDAGVRVTGTRWARLYFVVFYMLAVWVIANLFVAFTIETFTATLRRLQQREQQSESTVPPPGGGPGGFGSNIQAPTQQAAHQGLFREPAVLADLGIGRGAPLPGGAASIRAESLNDLSSASDDNEAAEATEATEATEAAVAERPRGTELRLFARRSLPPTAPNPPPPVKRSKPK